MDTVVITAPAKLNLFLHILGKQDNGFHRLESLVAFTEFGDQLEITPSSVITLVSEGPFAGDLPEKGSDNLILKAAYGLLKHAGLTRGARIVLNKRLPVAAGLGGGSSDAAATLKGLSRLWQLPRNDEMLLPVARTLGSDVPVCLSRQPSLVSGTGEAVAPVRLSAEVWAVLVNPGEALPTDKVFHAFEGPFTSPLAPVTGFDSPDALIDTLAAAHNGLQPTAVRMRPVIPSVLAALEKSPGCRLARMSGSGATCFGLFTDERAAKKAAGKIGRKHPGWWCVASRLGT